MTTDENSRPTAGGARSWLKRGVWSVLDQALFTVSNFLLNVMLARAMAPAEYGTFALAFTILLCLGIAHTALITEPMLVYGTRYEASRPQYLGALLRSHLTFSILTSALVALAAAISWALGSAFAGTLLSLALCAPFVLFLWLMRRACYLRFEPKQAAYAGALYLVLMGGSLYVLQRCNALSAASGFCSMAISSLGAGVWLLRGSNAHRHLSSSNPVLREVTSLHLKYGRWSIASGFLAWVPANFFYVLLPLLGAVEIGAVIRALMNFITPAVQVMTAMSTLLLPALVRARGSNDFAKIVRMFLTLFVVGTASYWLFLGTFHGTLVHILYRGRYAENASLLWALGVVPILVGISAVAGAALRALERPDIAFWANLAAAIFTFTFGTWMTATHGLRGAVVSILLGWSVLTGYLILALAGSSKVWSVASNTKVSVHRS